jgi:hypothetical protein
VNEANVTEEQVYKEHLKAVNAPAHWVYLLSVLILSFLLMVGFIALLGSGGG